MGISGALGMLMSLPCVAAMLVDLVSKGLSAPNMTGGVLIGVFAMIVSMISAFLLFMAFKPRKEPPFKMTAELERQVLNVARTQDGQLSLASLVMNSSLDTDQAQIALDNVVRKGLAAATFDDDGLLIYRFAGLSRGPAHVSPQRNMAQYELDAFDRQLGTPTDGTQFDFQEDSSSSQQQDVHSQHSRKKGS